MDAVLTFLKAADKQRHFEVCFGLTLALGYLLLTPLSLLVSAAACGVLLAPLIYHYF